MDALEFSRQRAWDQLSKTCTDSDMAALQQLARRIANAQGSEAQGWLMRIALDGESSEKVCVLLATAIAELRCRREEIRLTVERN